LESWLAAFTGGTGLVYAVLYYLFDRWIWRAATALLRLPNVGGKWHVRGRTLNAQFPPWEGELTITQTWERIAISLRTNQSSSSSETASILLARHGEAKFSYSYQNHPRPGEPLQKRQGFCELIFDPGFTSASGTISTRWAGFPRDFTRWTNFPQSIS
jgi:hypothetical protein